MIWYCMWAFIFDQLIERCSDDAPTVYTFRRTVLVHNIYTIYSISPYADLHYNIIWIGLNIIMCYNNNILLWRCRIMVYNTVHKYGRLID